MSDWKDTIKVLAPTVASALGGPLAGVAVTALSSILGLSDANQETLKAAVTGAAITPDQVAAIKKLELEYQNAERERGFKFAELEFKDRDSARLRESSTGDTTNRRLAYTIVAAFLGMSLAVLLGFATAEDRKSVV